MSQPRPFPPLLIEWRPDRVVRTFGRALRVATKSASMLSRGYLRSLGRALRLMGKELFTAEEIGRLGLLDPALDLEDLRRFTSRQMMTRIEKALNPEAWRTLAEHKGVFYRCCAAHNLPVPQLYALFLGDRAGWTHSRPVPDTREQWGEFLESACPDELVIKPAFGAYGEGVRVLTRTAAKRFLDPAGQGASALDLVDQMRAGAGLHGWVIQARIRNLPEVARLSGSPYLQCVRLITLTDRGGVCHILHGHLKVIVGTNAIDNFHHGATGNVTARIDLERGTLFAAVAGHPGGAGYTTMSVHPTTGVALEGFAIPFWAQACQLAREAARVFLPLRFVGWDIAITPDGPVLVEANWNSDPPNPHRRLHLLREAIQRLG
jgi:hypothetical protein